MPKTVTAPITHAELRTFFQRYAAALQSEDPRALAQLYAATFIAGGPQGSMAFANDERFLDWLRQVYAFNQSHQMRSLDVVTISPVELSPVHALAVVGWGARFERTGERLIEFQISYLVESTVAGPKVLAYVSQSDQQAQMKQLGLL